MASTIPKLRFVRCPTCLKVLAELPGITVYKCGGCGTTLQSKMHSSSGEIWSSASAAGSSKNKSDGGSPDNQKETFEKQTPTSSDHHGDKDQALRASLKVLVSSDASDSNGERLKEKSKYPAYEKTGIKGIITLEKEEQTEHGIPTKINLEKFLNKSSDQEIPNNSLNSSDKLEDSPESDTSSKDGKINGLLLRSNSQAYDGSVSSIDEKQRKHIPPKYLHLSRRTFGRRTSSVISGKVASRNGVHGRERDFSFVSEDFQSALNWMESENEAKQFVKFRCPEKDDKVKIIRKVDELKSHLLEYFQRTAAAKGHSRIGLTARFEGKIPLKQHQSSSLIPLSTQPNSPRLNPHHGGICRLNEHCRPCLHNGCCHLPESAATRPLHTKRCPSLRREPQNLQPNDKKLQPVKRHCRPVSGGAPFVICYKCYSLLQLPADFLVSTKTVHKLRCGSCDEVLRYVFRPRTRSMPWTPAEARHPPSEDDDKDVALDNESMVPVSNGLAGADPVSYSEEYGISFGQSNSYEADPCRHLERYDGIVEEEESGKKVGGSQLHKLMGYSSARYLLFENLSPGDGRRMGQDR